MTTRHLKRNRQPDHLSYNWRLVRCSVGALTPLSATPERLDFLGTGTETQSVVNELPEAGAVGENTRMS